MPAFHASSLSSTRLAGSIYLAIIGLGIFGEVFVRGSLVVSGNASSTATSILASQALWRSGIATDLLMHVLDVPLIVFLYLLLKPISKPLALLATALNVVQTCVLVANKLSLVAALLMLKRSVSATAVAPQDLHDLAYVAINLHGYGFGVGLIFFGFACLVRGYLMFHSDFVPRIFGVLLAIAGVSYLVNSFALLLLPTLAAVLFPAILLPAFVGELALSSWLLLTKYKLGNQVPLNSSNRAGSSSAA
jgi:hypothetical protein